MRLAILVALLAAVFALLAPAVQERAKRLFEVRPAAVWLLPPAIAAFFAFAAGIAGAFSLPLTAIMLVYTAAPVFAVCLARRDSAPIWLDFAAILLLWLPLEFAAGAFLVPLPARGFLHSVAYGIAILTGLLLFTAVRPVAGLKYNLPRSPRDLWLPLAGFALLAPVLIAIGIPIGFIPPPHLPVKPAGTMAAAVGIIFAGTALPEEILFRSLIQNFLMLRFGANWKTLAAASLIFGAAHLDNGPQPLPNWRYMILATIAGAAYGRVFQKSSTVISPAALHTMVDWTKHYFF